MKKIFLSLLLIATMLFTSVSYAPAKIILTTPPQVISVLGGSTPISYDRFILSEIHMNVLTGQIDATVAVSSTANPSMTPLAGSVKISPAGLEMMFDVRQAGVVRRIVLTTPQADTVRTIVANAQNAVESGLITLGAVAGTQTTGI